MFIMLDIAEFYPSIAKELLWQNLIIVLYIPPRYTNQDALQEVSPISNAWRNGAPPPVFDVNMYGARLCENGELFILHMISDTTHWIGLYRNEGLVIILKGITGRAVCLARKRLTKAFRSSTILTVKTHKALTVNQMMIRWAPTTLPNTQQVTKHIRRSTSKRLSQLSYNAESFNTEQLYNNTLKDAGFPETLKYNPYSNDKIKRESAHDKSSGSTNPQPPFANSSLRLIGKQFLHSHAAFIDTKV